MAARCAALCVDAPPQLASSQGHFSEAPPVAVGSRLEFRALQVVSCGADPAAGVASEVFAASAKWPKDDAAAAAASMVWCLPWHLSTPRPLPPNGEDNSAECRKAHRGLFKITTPGWKLLD
jgi:hypothetical protein